MAEHSKSYREFFRNCSVRRRCVLCVSLVVLLGGVAAVVLGFHFGTNPSLNDLLPCEGVAPVDSSVVSLDDLLPAGETAVTGTSDTFYAGLNLPPTQGRSGTGAFHPGVYSYAYSQENVINIKWHGFSAVRLPLNIPTVEDRLAMDTIKSYVDAIDGRAILCMFGTQEKGDGHGTGRVDNVSATAFAWAKVHAIFADYEHVKYELFNEPFGYSQISEYYSDMRSLILKAGLPLGKCIMGGMGYSSDISAVAKAGWHGDLAYHFYPTWLKDGCRTQENFSNQIQAALANLSPRVWVTEFGARLDFANPGYRRYELSGNDGNVNALRGLHDALLALKAKGMPVKGAFHFHGWHNDDSYDFWSATNVNGSEKVTQILSDLSASIPDRLQDTIYQ